MNLSRSLPLSQVSTPPYPLCPSIETALAPTTPDAFCSRRCYLVIPNECCRSACSLRSSPLARGAMTQQSLPFPCSSADSLFDVLCILRFSKGRRLNYLCGRRAGRAPRPGGAGGAWTICVVCCCSPAAAAPRALLSWVVFAVSFPFPLKFTSLCRPTRDLSQSAINPAESS